MRYGYFITAMSKPEPIIPYEELMRIFLRVCDEKSKAEEKVEEQEVRIHNLLLQLHMAREELKRYKNG